MRTVIFLLALCCASGVSAWQQVEIDRFGAAEEMHLVEHEALPQPGEGEVLLRVLTASASFTDVMVRKGLYSGAPDTLPLVPGYDLVGVVEQLGPGVTGLAVGQRVAALTVWGSYAQYTVQPAQHLVPVPTALEDDRAVVLVLAYLTAYQMLHRVADLEAGDTVLIHGASGAVGTALSQLGRAAGLNLIGTASAAKHDYLRQMQVEPIDYRGEDFVERTLALTGGAGVAAAFDAIGLDNFRRSYEVLSPGGHLVTYGLYTRSLEGEAGSLMTMLPEFLGVLWQQALWDWFPEQDRSVTFYSIADMRDAEPGWFRDDLAALFEMAVAGEIQPMIWKLLPLAQVVEAHRAIEQRQVRGKIVLRVGDAATP